MIYGKRRSMNTVLTKSQQLLYELIKAQGGEVEDKTKLAKLQYLADFIHYAFNRKPISEEATIYTRQKQGPLSNTLSGDLATLIRSDLIKEPSTYHYALSTAKFETALSEQEKYTVHFVVEKYGRLSWNELVNISHTQVPYLSTKEKAVVPFFTADNLIDDHPDYVVSRD